MNLERAPLRFASDQELLEILETETETRGGRGASGPPSDSSRSLRVLRELDVELVHALESEGRLDGALMLGPKRNGTRFTADDLLLLGSLGQVVRVALQGARVQQVVARMSEELQHKTARLNEQQRLIAMLQSEITSRRTAASPVALAADPAPFRREMIKGSSPAIREVLETVRKVSQSQSSVLVRGESGTGKELLALALHDNSPRRNGPLVSVHCGALAPSLLESELFGHVKGAFTGAHRDKVGRFEMANGGTLFLDEIGDITADTQVKLLRVLQQREFEPVGGSQTIPVDVRLIAATHQNLERLIAEGKFREDLYYRLNVISIALPPLRERGDDIIELALHFLSRAAERSGKRVTHLDEGAMEALRRYPWPGNIRELENAIERAVVLVEGDALTVADLPAAVSSGVPLVGRNDPDSPPRPGLTGPGLSPSRRRGRPPREALAAQSFQEPGKDDLLQALARAGGNKAEAARLLGVPRSTFFSRMKRFGLE
jgi:transcriptional regulator with GAF, ATPase, and Fis domain